MISKYEISKMIELAMTKFSEFSSKAVLIKPQASTYKGPRIPQGNQFDVDIVILNRTSNDKREYLNILIRSRDVFPNTGDSLVVNSNDFIVSKTAELSIGVNRLWNIEVISI